MNSPTSTKRPPVVAVMGHIDHGKSTLLDYIRKANTTAKEAGGITQNMSAYEVVHKDAEGLEAKITFLDTPGHEAFSKLRKRGSKVADLAILVVAADDGVKPQTIEAMKSIKESNIPFIIAINKIDKPQANIERTKLSLAEAEIYVEGYGGDISCVPICALNGQGVDELLTMLLLLADISDLKADSDAPAEGIVIEANRDKTRGISATLIIKNGTLKQGQYVVSGKAHSPVRIMQNFEGKQITSATYSEPIKIIGWSDIPPVGLPFKTCADKKEAEVLALNYVEKPISSNIKSNESRFVVPIIIKAATTGVIEAIAHEIDKLHTDRAFVKIVYSAIGDISENDIKIAAGKDSILVLGFDTKIDNTTAQLSERLNVTVKTFNIIYKLAEYVEEIIKERTPKMEAEEQIGVAKILKCFSKVKDKQIMGGRVEQGKVTIGCEVKIMRRDAEIGRGRVRELQQAKNKTNEIEEGNEFGTMIESKTEIAAGDKIEAFAVVIK